MEEVTEVY